MSILRMASFKASYALFLKLVSGAIRTIAISASAMVGNALVCFRTGTTDLLHGRRLVERISDLFLAYQMPECQVARVFYISLPCHALTILSLAYQMPYPPVVRRPDPMPRQGRDGRFYRSPEHRLRCAGNGPEVRTRCRRARELK